LFKYGWATDSSAGLDLKRRSRQGAYSKQTSRLLPRLLQYLIDKLQLSRKSNIIPGGHIHHFRHFMDFPKVLTNPTSRPSPFRHPALKKSQLVSEVIQQRDVMLHFPYHSFDPVIDLLREAAMDDDVLSIQITAYRLASNSKVINALINASRNGKKVVVCPMVNSESSGVDLHQILG
jgi:polyphosphate kinase